MLGISVQVPHVSRRAKFSLDFMPRPPEITIGCEGWVIVWYGEGGGLDIAFRRFGFVERGVKYSENGTSVRGCSLHSTQCFSFWAAAMEESVAGARVVDEEEVDGSAITSVEWRREECAAAAAAWMVCRLG